MAAGQVGTESSEGVGRWMDGRETGGKCGAGRGGRGEVRQPVGQAATQPHGKLVTPQLKGTLMVGGNRNNVGKGSKAEGKRVRGRSMGQMRGFE